MLDRTAEGHGQMRARLALQEAALGQRAACTPGLQKQALRGGGKTDSLGGSKAHTPYEERETTLPGALYFIHVFILIMNFGSRSRDWSLRISPIENVLENG